MNEQALADRLVQWANDRRDQGRPLDDEVLDAVDMLAIILKGEHPDHETPVQKATTTPRCDCSDGGAGYLIGQGEHEAYLPQAIYGGTVETVEECADCARFGDDMAAARAAAAGPQGTGRFGYVGEMITAPDDPDDEGRWHGDHWVEVLLP